jgi:hypothetical protein
MDLPPEEQIDRLPNEANWDSYGAEPVSAEMRERAKALLRALAGAGIWKPEIIGPTPDGGIDLRWKRPPEEWLLSSDISVHLSPTEGEIKVFKIADFRGMVSQDSAADSAGVIHWLRCHGVATWRPWEEQQGSESTADG